ADRDLATLAASGADVRSVAADVTRAADVDRVVRIAGPSLRGVVHAAGTLDDAVVMNLDRERLVRAMAPKTLGAWHLHRATAHLQLDFLALFSSVAPLPGRRGQANYAAGNAFLDALAFYRRGAGRAAVAINWGPWADEGMAAAASDATKRRWAARSLHF